MTLKELHDIAADHLKGLPGLNDDDIRLEQVEHFPRKRLWEVVVSYITYDSVGTSLFEANMPNVPGALEVAIRIYKKLIITEDKQVKGFYIYLPK